MLHLVGIPVGSEVAEVDNLYIGAVTFYLLGVPEGECVIVAVGEYDSVLVHRVEVVHAEVAGGISA